MKRSRGMAECLLTAVYNTPCCQKLTGLLGLCNWPEARMLPVAEMSRALTLLSWPLEPLKNT